MASSYMGVIQSDIDTQEEEEEVMVQKQLQAVASVG